MAANHIIQGWRQIIYFNMAVLKLIGRILIVLSLVSSAYLHLQVPSLSTKEFSDNYAVLDNLSQQYLQFDLPWDNTNWLMAARIFGLFEALVVLLIIFGDSLGGILFVLSVVGEIFFILWPKVLGGKIQSWSSNDLSELSHFLTLLGIGLVLACAGCNKQK